MHHRLTIFVATILFISRSQGMAENLLINGSFESPLIASNTITSLHAGDTNIYGWSIGGTRSIYLATTPQPQLTNAVDGNQFVDFNGGNESVTLSQTFPTEIGQTYDVEFSVGQYQAPQITFKLEAAVIDAGNVVLTNRTITAPQSLGWLAPSWLRFAATTSTSTLRFTDTNGTSNVDLMLDAVSVRRVTPQVTIERSPLRLRWQTDTNYVYQIQFASQLSSDSWSNFGGIIPGTGGTNYTDLSADAASGFFRIAVLPAQQ